MAVETIFGEESTFEQVVIPAGVFAAIKRGSFLDQTIMSVSLVGYSMPMMILNIALPVYAVTVLGLPGWITGVVFTVNCIMVGLGQGLVGGLLANAKPGVSPRQVAAQIAADRQDTETGQPEDLACLAIASSRTGWR